jgi:ATP-dependent exoDNAse (exonuclease V) beta subunit
MAVGTIHGFARRLLRDHALEAGIDPDAEILDEQEASLRRTEAARATVLAAIDAGRAETQRLVATYGVGGLRPGLADAIANVMRERATLGDTEPFRHAPDATAEALALRSALLDSADALLEAAPEVATASGKRAMERLRDARARFRVNPREWPAIAPLGPAELAAAEELAAILRGWRAGKSDSGRARALKSDLALACERFAPVAAEAMALPQLREVCALVTAAEERHRAGKRRDRVLDFDDLLVRMRDLLRAPGGTRDELRRRFRAVLVDEYQDVNRVQQEILDLLTGEEQAAAGEPAPRPLLVAVGDLKQSIYRFRGADVSVFRGVVERFRGGRVEGRVLHLVENHRSSPAILELVNTVFSRCMQPPA